MHECDLWDAVPPFRCRDCGAPGWTSPTVTAFKEWFRQQQLRFWAQLSGVAPAHELPGCCWCRPRLLNAADDDATDSYQHYGLDGSEAHRITTEYGFGGFAEDWPRA